jgi:APA family basic amino acid/polyamine antiporter
MGEEVRDPQCTIPCAIPVALALVLVIYAVVGVGLMVTLDSPNGSVGVGSKRYPR